MTVRSSSSWMLPGISLAPVRIPTQNAPEVASRIARMISWTKRMRFSSGPPYSSVRVLYKGERKASGSVPCEECSSTPSSPPSWQRRAAAPKAAVSSWI